MRANALRLSIGINVILLVLIAIIEWPSVMNYMQGSSDRKLCQTAKDALVRYQANQGGMWTTAGGWTPDPPSVISRRGDSAVVYVPLDPE